MISYRNMRTKWVQNNNFTRDIFLFWVSKEQELYLTLSYMLKRHH